MRHALVLPLFFAAFSSLRAADANRLAYLDEADPYYVGRGFPRLTTPQWVGEDGVEAVVILGIDDMRDPAKYEAYLRPILRRLQQIDGRAPLSIMTCNVDPQAPQLQQWLKEGLSLETHSIDHPCPLLKLGLDGAKSTYDRCVDVMSQVPGSKPVAFRVPCCDSLNTPSPRFWAEIFNQTTPAGRFLEIDTSVFNVFTSKDPALPGELVYDANRRDRFRKYLPADRSFVNTIEDYPYPYVIGKKCWEFPCVTPSDWAAQHFHKPYNPITVRDWQAALDATVIKQGVFCLVFHPHGWIKNEQVVELIDHAVAKHGKKVKFLTFREALDRINKNALHGSPVRHPESGRDNGVRLVDVNDDGFLDVVVGNDKQKQTYLWSPSKGQWVVTSFPTAIVTKDGTDAGVRFGLLRVDPLVGGRTVGKVNTSILVRNENAAGLWHYSLGYWTEEKDLLNRIDRAQGEGKQLFTSRQGRDLGVRLRDLAGSGRCQIIVSNPAEQAIFGCAADGGPFDRLPFALPAGAWLVNADGKDNGVRFRDINGDGHDDVIFSNEKGYGVYLYTSAKDGWGRKAFEGKPGDPFAMPLISRNGTNNGAWFHSEHLWWQNEDTTPLKDLVARRSFAELREGDEPLAKSPEAALRSLQARPGFTVEQVAAEPLTADPVAFAWGPDGKFWVVEMGDYPLGVDGKGKPGGKVRFLEDTDGDGKYDKATVFLEDVPFPTSVLPWKKGVLVTAAPEIFYAEDTDGDGKADKREPLFVGFGTGNQQHRVNSLVWGLDNWLYCANGDSAGKVKSVKTGQVLDIRGRDLRIRPDTGEMELQSGQTQYGRSRDDWGNWFGNNNSNPMYHFALDDHYLRRNAYLALLDPRVQVSVTPGAAVVYPISRPLPRFNNPQSVNHFTSACSAIVYRDELFGPQFTNNTFVSEPVHNLVHREIMTPAGSTFTSRRAADEQASEFLASTDNWFRPAMIQTGPDGALWVADMYRFVIEHPEWIPKDWQQRLDLRAGHDKGRIYHVFPTGQKPRAIPRLDKLDTAGLVAALDSPSGWQRDLAQMMLLWRLDTAAIGPLEKMAAGVDRPLARLHALGTLDGLGALKPELVRKALADAHPGVRRQAVRLAEPFLAKDAKLGDALIAMVGDEDAQVRLQLACTLGEWKDARAGLLLGQLALKGPDDRFLTTAVLSSVNADNLGPMVLTVLKDGKKAPPALVESLLRLASALNQGKALVSLLTAVSTAENGHFATWQFNTLAGLLDALDQRDLGLAKLHAEAGPEVKAAIENLGRLFVAARGTLANKEAKPEDQLAALRLLGRGLDGRDEDVKRLSQYLTPQTSDEMQAAAVATLGKLRASQAPEVLLASWRSYGLARRAQVLDVLLGRETWTAALLTAVEKKAVEVADIDAVRRQRLLEHRNADLRQRAAKLLAGSANPDRQKVVQAYQEVLGKIQGDGKRGAALFTKHCAGCHKLGDVGHVVGPDLAAVGDKSVQGLLVAVLDPNRVVETRYVSYTAITKSGLSITGVLASEAGNSITLLGPDGKQSVLLRGDLDELASSSKSPMPEGLERELNHAAMADLIAFVRGAVPPAKPKTFAGNQPELVRADANNVMLLTAKNAEIYGTSLVFEKKYGNLGYWNGDDDHAVWTVEVPKAGRYTVALDWACADASAGKLFLLEAGVNQLTGKVAGTGNWDTYKQAQVGDIVLAAGPQRLTFRPAKKLYSSALIDLRSVRLALAAEPTIGDVQRDAHGFRTHKVVSDLQNGPTEIKVLLPDSWDKERRYPVLYVLPVEAGTGDRFGNGLLEVKKLDLHNRHGLVCVQPTFADLPWYADHPTDPKIQQETYLLQVVLPFVEKHYGGSAKPDGRLLLGFSKSGWGAFSLLLRHPDVFGRAAAWDAPLNLDGPNHFGYQAIVGTAEDFAHYRITTLLEKQADLLKKERRLSLAGTNNFRAHHQAIHALLQKLEIPHEYRDEVKPRHTWDAGWVADGVAFLVGR